jgi:tRNA(Ile)-lysidine synthase
LAESEAPGKASVFLAALSGGADSTAMAAALAAIRDVPAGGSGTSPFTLYALHVNHGIRRAEECQADAEAVSALCLSLNIPLKITNIAPGTIEAYARSGGTGIEGAARYFRHTALREEARHIGAQAILIAHTLDDRLENILMAFLRGAGPAGLGAMGAANKKFSIRRPLIELSRADVLAYLAERKLSYRTDTSNGDERFLRNKVRLTLVPFLDQNFPRWREPVRRLGETQALTAAFLEDEAEKRLPWKKKRLGTGSSLEAETFFFQPEIIREEALFQALDKLVCSGDALHKKPRREVLRSFVRGRTAVLDLGNCRLENGGGHITLNPAEKPCFEQGFSVLIKSPGVYKLESLTVKAFELHADSCQEETGFFAEYPLVLRSRKGQILAEDKLGRAAVLAPSGLVWKRESSAGAMAYFSFFLSGGLDAFRPE